MSEFQDSNFNVQRWQWYVLGLTSLLISVFVVFFHLFRDVSLLDSLLGWLVSNLIASVVILFTFKRITYYQTQLAIKINELEAKAQRDAALAQLSSSLAVSLDEDEVCQELTARLQSIQGYDDVAIFTLDPETGNRVIRAEHVQDNLRSTPILQPGEGLSERPVVDGQLHYTPDISQTPNHTPGLTAGSEIDVPIQFDGEVMGVIVVESIEINAFDERDFEILTRTADQAALALKNARLLAAEKIRRQRAETLQRATNTLASALDINQVLEEILDQLRKVIFHDSACIFILEGDSVHAVAAHGLPKMNDVLQKRFPATDELLQLLFEKQSPVILDPAENASIFKGWGGTEQIRSWMGLPLIAQERVIGYLTLDTLTADAYDQSQARLAQIFAHQAAVAIENARLYRKAKDSSERQAVLHKVSQEIIRAGKDREQIYQAIHTAVAQLMPADSFVVSMLDEEQDEIEAVYLFDKEQREPPKRLASGRGLSWHVISTGQPVLACNYKHLENLQGLDVVHFGSEEHVRSLLAVPMWLGEKVIGMISTQTYQSYDYSNEDQILLDMLAAYAAIAINNAQLFSEVQHLAITDSLTGAHTRRHFFEVAQREIQEAHRLNQPVTIMMIDLDFFKEINDTHGHDTGDRALRLIVEQINRNIRSTDILARYGGDEFIVLLPGTLVTHGKEIAERVRRHFDETPIKVDDTTVKTTLSIGISGTDEQTPALNNLLKCADRALYQAKEAGRNCVKIKSCTI